MFKEMIKMEIRIKRKNYYKNEVKNGRKDYFKIYEEGRRKFKWIYLQYQVIQ